MFQKNRRTKASWEDAKRASVKDAPIQFATDIAWRLNEPAEGGAAGGNSTATSDAKDKARQKKHQQVGKNAVKSLMDAQTAYVEAKEKVSQGQRPDAESARQKLDEAAGRLFDGLKDDPNSGMDDLSPDQIKYIRRYA